MACTRDPEGAAQSDNASADYRDPAHPILPLQADTISYTVYIYNCGVG